MSAQTQTQTKGVCTGHVEFDDDGDALWIHYDCPIHDSYVGGR
jgi:hypothetical protein